MTARGDSPQRAPCAATSAPFADGLGLAPRGRMRVALAILLVFVVVGGLAALKGAQFSALIESGEEAQKQGPPPEAVATARASKASWAETIEAVGSVTSAKGVTVTSEVPGAVTRIAFDSGQ